MHLNTSKSSNHTAFQKTALATAITAALAMPQLVYAEDPTPSINHLLVSTLSDILDDSDGLVSIREAIQFANTNDQASNTITFAEDITGTIEVNEALAINKNLTITGPGKDVLTLQSNSNDLFTIDDPEVGIESGLDFDLSAVTLFGKDADGEYNQIIRHLTDHGGKITLNDIRVHKETKSLALVAAGAEDGHLSVSLTNSQIIGAVCTGEECPEGNTLRVETLINAGNTNGEVNITIEKTQVSNADMYLLAGASGNKAQLNIKNVDIENIQSEGKSVFRANSSQDTASLNLHDSSIKNSSLGLIFRSYSRESNSYLNIENSHITENKVFGSLLSIYGSSEDAINSFTMTNSSINNNEFPSSGLRFSRHIAASIIDSNINNNTVLDNYCCPGNERAMLYFEGNAANGVIISNSSISNNSQRAIYLKGDESEQALSLKVINSTLSGNQSTALSGGAIKVENANLTIAHSTIANNAAKDSAGGIYNQDGNVTISNSIIAANSILPNEAADPEASAEDAVLNADLVGSFTINSSLVQNLDNTETKSGWTTEIGDFGIHLLGDNLGQTPNTGNNLLGVDPLLQDLAMKGGLTLIRDLAENSPARNAGQVDADLITEFDQRGEGFPRLTAEVLDLGAVQFHSNPIAVDDSATLESGASQINIDVLANDASNSSDLALDLESVVIMEHPASGEAEVQANGSLVFTTADDFTGDVNIKYTVADIAGNRSNEAAVNIKVTEKVIAPDPEPSPDSVDDNSNKSSGGASYWLLFAFGLLSLRRFKK